MEMMMMRMTGSTFIYIEKSTPILDDKIENNDDKDEAEMMMMMRMTSSTFIWREALLLAANSDL